MNLSKKFLTPLLFLSVFLASYSAFSGDDSTPPPGTKPGYKKKEIVESRYGDAERQAWIKKANNVKAALDKRVIGQERATYSLQEGLIQYSESFGTRTREPVALHFIGLPGIGKSVMITELEAQGFQVVKLDLQKYASAANEASYESDLWNLMAKVDRTKPAVLVFDEIDKLPEMEDGREVTRPAIGALNQILTDGKLKVLGTDMSFSNIFVVSTMNFSPNEIEAFSEKVLGEKKSFYSFTIADFKKFDQWLNDNPDSRYQVLARLFRSNTVSRIAPNTSIFKPLDEVDYQKITSNTITETISRLTKKSGGKVRLEVTYSEGFSKYLADRTVVPASGARETVFRVDRLTDQIMGFATKYDDGSGSLDKPRKIFIDVDPATGKVKVTVTPQVVQGRQLVEKTPFDFELNYRDDVRLFERPGMVAVDAPAVAADATATVEKPLTRKEILAQRFPKESKPAKGLASKIDEKNYLATNLFELD